MSRSILNRNKKAYEFLYILENTFRKLIIKALTEKSNKQNISGWAILIQKNILERWEERKKKEERGYQIISSNKLINYSDFSDISDIIQKHWDVFSAIFNNQLIIISKLNELEPIRNTIAHNRELSLQEFKRLKIYFSDIKKILSRR